MPHRTAFFSCDWIVIAGVALLAVASGLDGRAATVTVSLDAVADLTSNFNTYWSAGIAQLNLTYPGTTRQPFWKTDDLSQTYNASFDFFPNDSAMKFGVLTYDDSSLISGSGSAAITGLTLGIEHDPLNEDYVNGTWLSFTTDLETYSGNVTVDSGAVTGISLTANYSTTGYFGPAPINGTGTFTVSGANFQVVASAYNPALGNYNPSVAWNWTGVISSVVTTPPSLAADFDDSRRVDSADLDLWRSGFGIVSGARKDQGDADEDEDVDGADFLIWQREVGMSLPQTLAANATVPEPSAALLLAMAAGAISRSRWSSRSGNPDTSKDSNAC